MEKTPQFIKEFSKEESPEERRQAAQEIRIKRAEHFTEKRAQTERQRELQQSTDGREQTLTEQLETISGLKNEITEISTSMLEKILNYFRSRKLRTDVVIRQQTYEQLKQLQDIEIAEEQKISGKLESKKTQPALREAKEILNDFYERQKIKWAKVDYTEDDIKKYFSEENLVSLSLEDYTLLLQRFPGEMVAHVTRQGIRDHVGHMYHSAGSGAYADGFMKIVEDGRLRSPLSVYLVETEKEQAIARFLHLDEFKNKEDALEYLAILTTASQQDKAGRYADRMAIHFATEEVADCYYGSEKSNEIFIVYPSAHIASQYYFSGLLTKGDSGYWNDQWVWANEEKGMDINAGIVFISEEAKVDRKTGSRYELDKNRNPIKNSEYQTTFRTVVDSVDFHNFANQVMKITDKRYQIEKLEPFRQKLKREFGIIDERLQSAILNYHSLSQLKNLKKEHQKRHKDKEAVFNYYIEDALRKQGILFSEAKDTISSKEFWEAHFAENPAKRPIKIVYYKGGDPTNAILQWRKEQEIDKKARDKDIGFPERRIERSAPQATAGLDRFKTLAERAIENYFEKEKSPEALKQETSEKESQSQKLERK